MAWKSNRTHHINDTFLMIYSDNDSRSISIIFFEFLFDFWINFVRREPRFYFISRPDKLRKQSMPTTLIGVCVFFICVRVGWEKEASN